MSTGKLIVGLCVIALAFVAAPIWGAAMVIGMLVVLWRWPGVGWQLWTLFLVGGLAVAVLSESAVSQTLVGSDRRPAMTAVATLPPAVVSATAVARQANDAYHRGTELWSAGDALAAIDAFTKAIDLRPNWSSAYNMRALARVSAGQLDAAQDDAQLAVEFDRSTWRVDTLDTRAYVLLKRGQHQAALADYNAVLAVPLDPPAASLLGRGIAFANLGQTEPARTDLNEGLRLAANLKLEVDPQLADLQAEAVRLIQTLPEANSPA
jgi:tetratricopeptide (TPR) repeat protein